MGCILVQDEIYNAFMNKDEKMIDLFHENDLLHAHILIFPLTL